MEVNNFLLRPFGPKHGSINGCDTTSIEQILSTLNIYLYCNLTKRAALYNMCTTSHDLTFYSNFVTTLFLQAQALIVGLLASFIAMITGYSHLFSTKLFQT